MGVNFFLDQFFDMSAYEFGKTEDERPENACFLPCFQIEFL